MRKADWRWSIVLLATLVFGAVSCGGGGGTATPDPNPNPNLGDQNPGTQAWVGTAGSSAISDPGFTGIPELPFDSLQASRVPSTQTQQLQLTGEDYMQMFNGVEQGDSLVLSVPAEPANDDFPVAFGLYKFSGLNSVEPEYLNIECLPEMFGQEYFVAIADYTMGDWRWFGPATFPEFQLDMRDLNHHVISVLGNMYFLVVCEPGNGATISMSTLTVAEGGGEGGGEGRLPGMPHQLAATNGAYDDHIVIEWEHGIDADYYKLWRKAGEAGEWGFYDETEDNRFEDWEVEPGAKCWYKAFAVNEHGESHHSNIDMGWAGDLGEGPDGPGVPYDLRASTGTRVDNVLVEWEFDGDFDFFEIWRKAPEGEWESYHETDGFEFEDIEVEPGVHYLYKAWAWLGDERGDHSNIDEGWAGEGGGEGVPPAFDLVASNGEFEDHVLVSWEYEHEGAGFDVYRRMEAEGEWDVIGETLEHEYLDFDVEPGVHYKYKVIAWLDGEPSEPSNYDVGWAGEDGGGELPAPFELWATKGEYPEMIEVCWEYEGPEGVMFELWRRIDDVPESQWEPVAEVEGLCFADDDLPGDYTYLYKVRAWQGEDYSEFSNIDHGYLADGSGPEGCLLEVYISDLESNPLAETEVVVFGGEEPFSVFTDAEGTVVVDGLGYGLYLVVPVHPERMFTPAYAPVDFSPELDEQHLDFVGELADVNPFILRGVVFNFHAEREGSAWLPMEGVDVGITLLGTQDSWTLVTDEWGYFESDVLPVGSYSVIPALEGHWFAPDLHDPVLDGETVPGLQYFSGYPQGE